MSTGRVTADAQRGVVRRTLVTTPMGVKGAGRGLTVLSHDAHNLFSAPSAEAPSPKELALFLSPLCALRPCVEALFSSLISGRMVY